MSGGRLNKDDLKGVSGKCRTGDQEAWFRSEPDLDALKYIEDDGEEDGLDGLLILPHTKIVPVGELPTGMDNPVSGVYALFAEDGALNYIGQSCDIGARIIQHRNAARRGERLPFTAYGYVEVCSLLVDAIETAHIYALEPPDNVAYSIVRWEYHAEAVAMLREAWGEKK